MAVIWHRQWSDGKWKSCGKSTFTENVMMVNGRAVEMTLTYYFLSHPCILTYNCLSHLFTITYMSMQMLTADAHSSCSLEDNSEHINISKMKKPEMHWELNEALNMFSAHFVHTRYIQCVSAHCIDNQSKDGSGNLINLKHCCRFRPGTFHKLSKYDGDQSLENRNSW